MCLFEDHPQALPLSPVTMERVGQSYGFIFYKATIQEPNTDDCTFAIALRTAFWYT